MRYPIMNRKPERTVEIPALSGGLNIRDGENAILDNQLSEAKNVWFKDSRLKTRPGMRFNEGSFAYKGEGTGENLQFQHHDYITNSQGNTLLSFSEWVENSVVGEERKMAPHIYFFWSDGTNFGNIIGDSVAYSENSPINYFVFQFADKIYCVMSWGMYCLEGENGERCLHDNDIEIDETGNVKYDFYIPTVLTNGLPQFPVRMSGTKWESYNRLGRYAKVVCSTVNLDLEANENRERHAMCYALPGKSNPSLIPKNFKDLKIMAVITDKYGNKHIHSIMLDDENYEDGYGKEKNPSTDNLYMSGTCTDITFLDENSLPVFIKDTDTQVLNNLEIYFPYENAEADKQVLNMSRCEWYGGASEGINGGTRLFLCGNTERKDQNLVIWSGLNNPLYFPDSAYFRVGDELQPVTAFGKQNDMLIIFKDSEIYGTQYTRSGSVSAEQVIEDGASYQSSSVYFPLTLLHSKIGCDIPNSVQLCKNRLVWANTNGNIYTLVSQNQYSERNVFPIGEMLKPKLKSISGFATSADVDGMYWLLDNGKMYVFDYNSYGYSYVSGYSKDEDSNLKIPSWYFELPRSGALFENGGRLRMLRVATTVNQYGTVGGLFTYDFVDGKGDLLAYEGEDGYYSNTEEKEIEFCFKTKLFDFGTPAMTKTIGSVNLSVSAAPLGFNVEYITEYDNADNECVSLPGMSGKLLNIPLKPLTRLNTHFGIKVSGKGHFEGDSLQIKYKTAGGAK